MTKPIGILGGTFDPVHHGHLRLALEVMDAAGLEQVHLVPVNTPPHREQPVATPEQRREMLRLALDGIDDLVLEECELQRPGISYTIDTLREIGARRPGTHLCLILGMDAFAKLNAWHEWQAIPETAHIIVVERPGLDTAAPEPEVAALFEKALTTDAAALRTTAAGTVLHIAIPRLDISATRLRSLFARGRDARFLLPPRVLEFIQQERLYMSETA